MYMVLEMMRTCGEVVVKKIKMKFLVNQTFLPQNQNQNAKEAWKKIVAQMLILEKYVNKADGIACVSFEQQKLK